MVALSDPRSILFRAKVQFFPIEELAFGKTFVRRLYATLAEPGGYPYDDLNFQNERSILSTARATQKGSGRSVCMVDSSDITIEESEPEVELTGFNEVVESVLKAVSDVKKGDCPPILALRTTIQCVAKPQYSIDSVDMLAGKVSNVLDKIDPFERPPAFFGLRFRFPPYERIEEDEENGTSSTTDERHDFLSLRYETWGQDIEQLWIEVIAQTLFQDTIEVSAPQKIFDNIRESYDFLTNQAMRFINQFDKPNLDDKGEEGDEQ